MVFHNYCIACHGYRMLFIVILHFWHTKINISFATSPTQFQDLYENSEMAMDIPAYSWTSVERMDREYPPTWDGGGARVCRGCAGPYLRKRLSSQKKSQKNTQN